MASPILNLAASIYFLKKLNTPFTSTDAYRLHLIDANGKRTKKPITTPQEKAAFSYYDILINNLKRLIALVPGGNTKLGRIAASFLLMREENLTEESLEQKFYEYYDEVVKNKLSEDEPVNVVGNAAGLTGEPPVTKKQANKYKKNNVTGEKKMTAETKSMILTALGRR